MHWLARLALLVVAATGRPAEARPSSSAPASRPALELPLVVRVARVGARAVVEEAWVEAQVREVNRLFGPHGVRLRRLPGEPLPAGVPASLESRADRDRLGAHEAPAAVTCFVVEALRDVDDPARHRRGVHWRRRGQQRVHYVILTREAYPSSLAHELVHYLGDPRHTAGRCELMSYDREGCDRATLDEGRARRLRAGAERALTALRARPSRR